MNAEERETWEQVVAIVQLFEAHGRQDSLRITPGRADAILAADATLRAAEQWAADLDRTLTEMCARVEDAEARAETIEDDTRHARQAWHTVTQLAAERIDQQRRCLIEIEARAEAAEAALAEAHIGREAWVEMHERLGAADAELAEAQESWQRLYEMLDKGASVYDDPVRELMHRMNEILSDAPSAAAQELSALREVAEAVSDDGDLSAADLRSWADSLERCLGYKRGGHICAWLRNVANALAALDAARGGGEREPDDGCGMGGAVSE